MTSSPPRSSRAAQAWKSATVDVPSCATAPGCDAEQIFAYDDNGIPVLDNTVGTGKTLANLELSGDLLTWTDDGAPRSATLK